ncbi:MAG TPA: flap endonuclease Xni, partial [Gammaproteobacteria bacterium]|nr:flap endonuclease Xni [Gammaproteobacteria bacterium]
MPILLIDGLNLIRRVHAGVPEVSEDRDEAVLNACVASVRRALRKHQPSHAVLVMEGSGLSWRSREYPDYKRDRLPMPNDLAAELPKIKDAVSEIGVHELSAAGFEADDVIASIAKRTSDLGFEVIILSTDKSFCQLVSPRITLVDHFNNIVRNRAWIQERYGVTPEQMVDLMSLAGDSSLGIPGI